MFIADYDNLRFDFVILIFLEWFGKDLGIVWERLCTPSEIFRSARFWLGRKRKTKTRKKEAKKKLTEIKKTRIKRKNKKKKKEG